MKRRIRRYYVRWLRHRRNARQVAAVNAIMARRAPRPVRLAAMAATYERTIPVLEARLAAGDTGVELALLWQRTKLASVRHELDELAVTLWV